MSKSHARLRFFRKVHLYFGVFISPAVLFFAFTGALQTFGLHEASHNGGSYKPPHWAEVLGQIHKKQTTVMPARKPASTPQRPAAGATDAVSAPQHEGHGEHSGADVAASQAAIASQPAQAPQKSHLPLKVFFLIVSLGLFTMVLTGIYMSYKYNQSKLVITGLLIAGVVVPLMLLPF